MDARALANFFMTESLGPSYWLAKLELSRWAGLDGFDFGQWELRLRLSDQPSLQQLCPQWIAGLEVGDADGEGVGGIVGRGLSES